MRRRKLLIGLGGLAGAGGIAGSGAFSSITANRDVTVAVASDTDALLKLAPSPTANGAYAVDPTNNDGQLALDFTETDAGGQGLGTDSVYDFDDVFRVTNQGTQPVYVWGTFGGASGNFTPSGSETDIWLYPNGDSETKLRDNGAGVLRLTVGETARIGVHVNTHDVTEDQSLTMTIHADAEKPAGAPGTTRPYPPISVSKAGESTRYFHTIPAAAEYASSGEDVVMGIEDGTYPRADPAVRITDPNDSRNWLAYDLSADLDVTFTGRNDDGYSLTIARDEYGLTGEPWAATVQTPGSQEDQNTVDFGLTVGLGELLDAATATGNELTFTVGSESITYTGAGNAGDAFVFSREGAANETISFVPSADQNDDGIERVTLTTSETSVSFTDAAALADAPTLLGRDPEQVTVKIPDSLAIEGRGGSPVIEHALRIDPGPDQRQFRVRELTFAGVRDDDSIRIEPTNSDTISDVRMIEVEFTAAADASRFGTGGVTITDDVSTVDGFTVDSCRFEHRFVGIQTDYGVTLTGVEVDQSGFESNQYGLWVSDIREGYVHDSEFVSNSVWGVLADQLDGVGFDGVTMAGNGGNGSGGALRFSGGITNPVQSPLEDRIESNVGDDQTGVTGIVNSTFENNVTVADRFGSGPDIPTDSCTFSNNGTKGDIDRI